jgi:chromosome segregation ATPase
MREKLEQRLEELKKEFESGQKTLGGLEAKQADLRNTLLRISGAIQILEEELYKENNPTGNGDGQSAGQGEIIMPASQHKEE